jgi:hypothetical protein
MLDDVMTMGPKEKEMATKIVEKEMKKLKMRLQRLRQGKVTIESEGTEEEDDEEEEVEATTMNISDGEEGPRRGRPPKSSGFSYGSKSQRKRETKEASKRGETKKKGGQNAPGKDGKRGGKR